MSRAFVKEDADAPEPPLPERAISPWPNRVTPRGARLITETIATLKGRLAGVAEDEPALVRRDLRYWHARQASMQIVALPAASDVVGFGTRVTVRRGTTTATLSIVGEDEADPMQGSIAWTSPLARALDGAEAGDVVELETAGRRETIEVVSIEV